MNNLLNNQNTKKISKWTYPHAIIFVTFLIYLTPALIIELTNHPYLASYSSGLRLKNPIPVYGIISALSALVFIIFKFPILKISVSASEIENKKYLALVLASWIVIFLYSMIELNDSLELITLAGMLFTDVISFSIRQPMIGVILSEGGKLKYYFLAHFGVIIWFYIFSLWDKNSISRKFLLILTFLGLIFIYFLMTRREILIYAILVFMIGFGNKINIKIIAAMAILSIASVIASVNLRIGSDHILDLSNYFASEEFYPFQLSAFLIDSWIDFFEMRNPLEMTPINLIGGGASVLSPQIVAEKFNHFGPGPTIGIFYPIISFGFILPILYLVYYSIIINSIHTLYLNPKTKRLATPIYSFLILKLFLLVRNGEFVNNLIDCLIFSILYTPFFFIEISLTKKES